MICFLGIGGSGMRGLAHLLAARGEEIVGTDRNIARLRSDPALQNFTLLEEAEVLQTVNRFSVLIYSDAVPPDHPLRQRVREAGVREASYNEILGELTQELETVAVAGTHGKSSTTAFLAHIFEVSGQQPQALVGAEVVTWPHYNVLLGNGGRFIVEADEYRDHFLTLNAKHAIITSIDHDHPDYFPDIAATLASFQKFLDALPKDAHVVTPGSVQEKYADTLRWPTGTVAVSFPEEKLDLPLPGKHMQQNAWLAITMAEKLGVPREVAIRALASFPGLRRRFEKLGEIGKMQVFTDYGHHPTEIGMTLSAAREKFPDAKILILFEPHMQARLTNFYDQFLAAFAKIQLGVVMCPIYHARGEVPDPELPKKFASDLEKKGIAATTLSSLSEVPEKLKVLASDYDIALAFSAGDLDGVLRDCFK